MDFEIRNSTQNDWPYIASIYQQGIDTNMATFHKPLYQIMHLGINHI